MFLCFRHGLFEALRLSGKKFTLTTTDLDSQSGHNWRWSKMKLDYIIHCSFQKLSVPPLYLMCGEHSHDAAFRIHQKESGPMAVPCLTKTTKQLLGAPGLARSKDATLASLLVARS